MQTTRLSSKGQVILPKSVREAHHWHAGTQFTIEDAGDGVLLRPCKPLPRTTLDNVAGMLAVAGPARNLDEMEAAIDAEIEARRDRGRY